MKSFGIKEKNTINLCYNITKNDIFYIFSILFIFYNAGFFSITIITKYKYTKKCGKRLEQSIIIWTTINRADLEIKIINTNLFHKCPKLDWVSPKSDMNNPNISVQIISAKRNRHKPNTFRKPKLKLKSN